MTSAEIILTIYAINILFEVPRPSALCPIKLQVYEFKTRI